MTEGILSGISVLDLSWGLAGPVATQILAEAGADVVKVERPGGDPLRTLHPAAFATWNRSKRGVVIDLKEARDRATLDRLLATVDVVVHGFTPARAIRYRLDDERLTSEHPRLVVCGITGYPPHHADAERPGYDILVQARSGLMDFQAGLRPGPFTWRFPVPSWFAAVLAALGITARLFDRERSGRGGVAHTSLLQGARLASNMTWSRAEKPPPALARGLPPETRMPRVAMYQCADGEWIQIMNPADRVDLSTLPLTVKALGELGLADAPFDADVFSGAMALFPSDQWLEAIHAVDVAVERVVPLGDILRHDEAVANDFVVDVDDPIWGRTRQAGAPFRTHPQMRVRSPAPQLGQHGALLAEIAPAPPTASDNTGAARRHPLEGLKVLDLGAFLAGPLAPMLLGDLGADVIKVEPVTGDPVRGWRDDFFIACNRGKRGIALNISTPEGREVLGRLIDWADVVHHNVRIRASARLGIDEETVRARNPRAVFSHGSAYGRNGQRVEWPGYDSVFQAMSGWNVENAGDGNAPMFVHMGYLDTMTGTLSAIATLLALYHRERTGAVSSTHAALLNSATFTNSETLVTESGETAPYPRLDTDQTGFGPGYRIYEASDGWVAVAAAGDAQRAQVEALAAAVRDRTTADILADLEARGVPAELVREGEYFCLFDDEDNLRSGIVASYGQADWGEMRQAGAFWLFRDREVRLDRACPALGEHSREILGELGYDGDEVLALVNAGVVKARSE